MIADVLTIPWVNPAVWAAIQPHEWVILLYPKSWLNQNGLGDMSRVISKVWTVLSSSLYAVLAAVGAAEAAVREILKYSTIYVWSAAAAALVPSLDEKQIPLHWSATRNMNRIFFYQWLFVLFMDLHNIILFHKDLEIV